MNSNANTNTNSSPEEEGSSREPPFFVPFETLQGALASRRRNLTPALLFGLHENQQTRPLFTGPNFDEEGSEYGSSSSESDKDMPEELLCSICGRRHECIRFVVCGHGTCPSCMKKTWLSRINRPDRARDPWPVSIPCPFCRAGVTAVIDEREDATVNTGSTVGGSEAPHLSSAETSRDGTVIVTGGVATGAATVVGGQAILIVDWMLRNSQDAAWRLCLEIAERAATAGGEASSSGGGRDRGAWNNEESSDWNEMFFE